MTAYDDRAIMLVHHVPDDAREHEGHDVSIVIGEEAVVRALRDLMERVWAAHAPAAASHASSPRAHHG